MFQPKKESDARGTSSADSWVCFRRVPQAKVRLFCFPFAGGSANFFHHWALHLAPDVEVYGLQQPGKGQRIGEQPHLNMLMLLEELLQNTPALMDRPTIFFGHSMGAWIAYELTRRLERKPDHLILSAADPELRPKILPIHRMDDDQLLEEMKALGGTPQEILDDMDFFRQFFPIIRADFKMLETHGSQAHEPLRVSATIWSGARDPRVAPAIAQGWVNKFADSVPHKTFAGGHMFLGPEECGKRCLSEIGKIAGALTCPSAEYLAVC